MSNDDPVDKLRVLIVDDELIARKRLLRLLTAMPDVEVAGECTDGEEVLARVKEGDVDVILLDVQMAKLSGIETMGLLSPEDPLIIFVTAHSTYAVDAFEGGAADYLLKPIEAARLKKALDRAKSRLEAKKHNEHEHEPEARPERLAVPTRNGLVIVDPKDISYAIIDGETVMLHTARGDFVTDFRINVLEKKLQSGRFERVHRRALLNLDHVTRLEPVDTGGYLALMTDGRRVPVSRQAARRLRRLWDLPKA